MSRLKTVLCASLFLLLSSLCNAVLAAPEPGWWWNPSESGRGFFVESQDGVTFIGFYFYDSDGHATWLVAGGANADPYNYTGPLYSELNGQTLFGGYVASTAPTSVGTLTAHFSDDRHGTLTWPGGTIAIERTVFGVDAGGTSFRPATGWYWNPDESGTGYSIELQGNNLFIVGYIYDDSGRPVWYLSAGPMNSDRTYSGPVLQFANGQTMSGPYHPPGAPATVATLDLAFTDVDEANITFTETAGAVKGAHALAAPRTRTDHVQKTFARPFPNGYFGGFFLKATVTGDVPGVSVDYNLGAFVKLTRGVFDADTGNQPYVIAIDQQNFRTLTVTLSGTTPGGCTEKDSGVAEIDMPPDSVKLQISADKTYRLSFNLPLSVVPSTITCPPGPPVTIASVFPGLAWFIAGLPIQDGFSNGTRGKGYFDWKIPPVPARPGVVVSGEWSFVPQ